MAKGYTVGVNVQTRGEHMGVMSLFDECKCYNIPFYGICMLSGLLIMVNRKTINHLRMVYVL